jgi:CDP-glucose 4,6-dehydratase
VQWIAERMAQKWGGGAAWTTHGGNHPHEANYLKLDISKAAQQLRWTPIIRLEKALDWIVDWALARNAGDDIRALTLAQISAYDALASEAG